MQMRILAPILLSAALTGLAPQAASAAESAGPAGAEEAYGCVVHPMAGAFPIADALADAREHYTGQRARLLLAAALTVQETAIGIAPAQQEAWRAYTNAALALVPERERVLAVLGGTDEDPKGPPAFGRAEALADALLAYGAKAQALKQAIEALRGKLTPAQLEAARVPRLKPSWLQASPF